MHDISKEPLLIIDLDIKIGDYVVASYDNILWIGKVEDYDENYDDYLLNFLYPSGINIIYKYPERSDKCRILKEHIVKILTPPRLISGSRLKYSFDHQELNESHQIILRFFARSTRPKRK
jgi:hypothetical protein